MLRSGSPSPSTVTTNYTLPQIYLEQKTGLTFTGNQKENGEMDGTPIDAGNKLYVPEWVQDTGAYDAVVTNKRPIGSHFMNFNLLRHVNVEAYMFNHTDSNTPEDDELLIHPMEQSDIPVNW